MGEKNKPFDADALRKEFNSNKGKEEKGRKTEPAKIDFCCPICHNKHYNSVMEHNDVFGPGAQSWVTHYECFGCSVLFNNPEKFTNAKKH